MEGAIEHSIGQDINDTIREKNYNRERTFTDKVLGLNNSERVIAIIKKSPLTREDMNELYSYMTAPEIKMLNFDEGNRYVIMKYFVWVADFVKIAQKFYDYQDYLRQNKYKCATCDKSYEEGALDKCECLTGESANLIDSLIHTYNYQVDVINSNKKTNLEYLEYPKVRVAKVQTSKYFNRIFEDTRVTMENNVKFLTNLFFSITRSSLSVNSAGIKYELVDVHPDHPVSFACLVKFPIFCCGLPKTEYSNTSLPCCSRMYLLTDSWLTCPALPQ